MSDYRPAFNAILGTIAALAALASLGMGLDFFMHGWAVNHAKLLVGSWVIFPPVFFWLDWVVFCRDLPAKELDAAKHTHEVSRNIWLALIVVLVALFEIKWPGCS